MKKLLFGILAVCLVLCMCACGSETADTSDTTSSASPAESSVAGTDSSVEESSEPENTAAFLVKVVDGNGDPVEGVMVQICKDTCIPAKTDAEGFATFNIEITDGYKLSVLSCPEGYEYTGEAEVYLESGATEITVELTAKG